LFPPSLDQVPESERAAESFGWMPALFGLAMVAGGIAMVQNPPRAGWQPPSLAFLAALFLGGAGLLYLEFRRRSGRTALVRREGQIGVYRRGQLSATLSPGQVTRYHLRLTNTIQYLVFPVLMTGMMLVLLVKPPPKTTGEEQALFLVGALAFGAVLASMVRTRLLLHHFLVPKRAKGQETVMLARYDSARAFPPAPR
jgi:hypothetical protein